MGRQRRTALPLVREGMGLQKWRMGGKHLLRGPYTIGFLQWDGQHWIDQPAPAFAANEDWEHGSVYEPNLIYHDGKWKMWYVAGSNQADYLVQGYAESEDGSTGWSKHIVFAPPEMKMFDFCVRQRGTSFDAIFARVWVGAGTPRTETGLWWCRAANPPPFELEPADPDHGGRRSWVALRPMEALVSISRTNRGTGPCVF